MKLIEALTLLRDAPKGATPLRVFLACGFTPLHLQTLLAGHLQRGSPDRRASVEVGLFGDLAGNVARAAAGAYDGAAVVIEWPDLDPRLGARGLGGFRPRDLPDVARGARDRLARLRELIAEAAARAPVALSLPTLPLPPIAYAPRWQASPLEVALAEAVASFAASAAEIAGVRLVSATDLARRSPPDARFDVRMDLEAGHPYLAAHTDALASSLALLIRPPPAKKGLITDLDDTLWKGIVGDDGVEGVRFDLEGHAQIHGLYQQVLASLADTGVLVAVASKNDPAVAARALAREDLLVSSAQIFPIEASWGPKSEAVARILATWNVGADSVVFVDDNAMELAEVQAAFPAMECLRFPAADPAAAYALLFRLRELFGKESIGAEDLLRSASLRGAAQADAAREGVSADRFLEEAAAEIRLDFSRDPFDPRALELVNKTNQFNINGARRTEAEWKAALADPEAFLLVASYKDRFGPLGKIAVMRGRRAAPREIHVDTWVMSCRAFSRRIEHRCLERLFARFDADAIVFDFSPTDRNGPSRELLESLLGEVTGGPLRLERARFAERCPRLFQHVSEGGESSP